jgi:1-aminocyclopropane-1-carboxylate deaminase/D-cysteine desulfhydrase-like pyridoxal-dependent ACC family enzyme
MPLSLTADALQTAVIKGLALACVVGGGTTVAGNTAAIMMMKKDLEVIRCAVFKDNDHDKLECIANEQSH